VAGFHAALPNHLLQPPLQRAQRQHAGRRQHHSALIEAEDLAALLDAWQARPAVLVGSSYGAFTALALAVARPEWVRAMVLLEPPMLRWADFSEEGRAVRAAFDRDVRLPARAAFERGDDSTGVRLLTGGIVGAASAAQLPAAAMQRRLENALSMRMLALSADEFPMIEPHAVRQLRMPVALMAGADTPPIHDVVFRNLVRGRCRRRKSAAFRVPGHGAARDNPQAFNQAALSFLKRHGLND
jgi:esterase